MIGGSKFGIRQFEAIPNSRFRPEQIPVMLRPNPNSWNGSDDLRHAIRWTSQLRAILPFAAHEHDEFLFFENCVPSPQEPPRRATVMPDL